MGFVRAVGSNKCREDARSSLSTQQLWLGGYKTFRVPQLRDFIWWAALSGKLNVRRRKKKVLRMGDKLCLTTAKIYREGSHRMITMKDERDG